MSEEKTGFLDSQIYPILFMIIITVVFVGILSVFYRTSEKGIEAYKKQAYQLQILTLFVDTLSTFDGTDKFDLPIASLMSDPKALQDNFSKYITEMQLPNTDLKTIKTTYYKVSTQKDNVLGYCFDISGSGLWGTMRALIAVTPDFGRIINFVIYDQMETPGLGARVEEDWFKQQFAGKSLVSDTTVTNFSLVQEQAAANASEVMQITGATITSASVLKMISSAALELKEKVKLPQ